VNSLYMNVKNRINELPEELISIIYDFDGRYKNNFNVCIYELYTHIYSNRVLNQLFREVNPDRSLYDYIRWSIRSNNINNDESN